MLVVLLVAAALRLWALPSFPVGLHYDEAANLILARQIAEGQYRPVFIQAYTGKEVLFFYAVAPWVRMTGGSPWGLRLGAAMLGILTVAATYAATSALLGPRKRTASIALFAAAWIAVAFPHVLLSRYGFRAISQPLLQALTVAALWRGLRSGRWSWLVAGGAFLGLTAYTYLAARLFPVPLGIALGWLLVRSEPRARRRLLGQLALVLAVALAALAPLGLFFLQHPEAFTTRITQVASPNWSDALRGIWLCLRALVWPGAGDGYVRFNLPHLPLMDVISALLALLGLVSWLRLRRKDSLGSAAFILVIGAIVAMILPSGLATGELTPSNLRMAGLFPFLALLPAWGLSEGLRVFGGMAPGKWQMRTSDGRPQPSAYAALLPLSLASLLFVGGAARTASIYARWSSSDALFRAADGEMVLAARALDAAIETAPDPAGVTVYIASEHYRHPTVAALAEHYEDAKWLTGGATLVLPEQGDAVYLVPDNVPPPAPWPKTISDVWTTVNYPSPSGAPALASHQLAASALAGLRQDLMAPRGDGPDAAPADFAHVVRAYDAVPMQPCRVAASCPILVTWEAVSSYPTLQPVLRLFHPESGEWARTMPFHYPAEEWTPGEVVLDQLVVVPPVGVPPVEGYEVGVGFYDPDREEALPRLVDERFGGFEARYPGTSQGLRLFRTLEVPTPEQVLDACPGIPRTSAVALTGLDLLGWTVTRDDSLLPGSKLALRLCWLADETAPPFETVTLRVRGADAEATLFMGPPAEGYAFADWRAGEVVEDRSQVQLPRSLPAGDYGLELQLDGAEPVELERFEVQALARTFSRPDTAYVVDRDFTGPSGAQIRLLGYDLGEWDPGQPWQVTLVWQAIEEMPQDYVVFLHLRDAEADAPVAQVDEMPRAGGYPTSLWMSGEVVTDDHVLTLPPDLAPGDYVLYVGLYLTDGTHLTVDGAQRLRLAEVTVAP